MKFTKSLVFILICSVAFFGCDDDDQGGQTPTDDYQPVITSIANSVIVATYNDLNAKATTLNSAVQALQSSQTAGNLAAARTAWVNARQPWERSEGFLFGPVDTEGIDPALDSWPVNRVDLDGVLSSSDALTPAFIKNQVGTLKGFHTIEYLLWGNDGQKTIDEFNAREFEYLVSTTQVLREDAGSLATSWNPSNGNFVRNLLESGTSNSIYVSQKAALEELAGGILGIADEVGNGKINDPLEGNNLTLEESQFSDNSKTDFTDNIISIQNVYNGVNGSGLSSIVAAKNATLDTRIKAEIQGAINAIQAIPGTFTAAIPPTSPTRAAAEFAQSEVRKLQATFESDLIPLISGL